MKLVAFTLLSFFCMSGYSQSITEGNRTVEKTTYVYKTVGKTPIHADLYRAAGDAKVKPVIVWIHGGGLINGSRTGLKDEQRNLYIDAGYSIVSIDYRLAPEAKIPAIVEDLKDAIQWVRRKSTMLQVDPARLFVVGHSAGAYLTLVSGYILKEPPRAIVSFYGYGDIRGDWYSKPDSFYVATRPLVPEDTAMKQIADSVVTGSTAATSKGRGDIYMYTRQTGKWPLMVGGRDPQKDEQWFYKYCPLKNVRATYPPTLLLHGDKDTDVPFEQSVQMDRELTAKKIPHKFIRMKNSEHGFDHANGGLSNPDIKKAFNEVVAFLDSYK
jgi:acetyl esterase/lipase